MIKRFAATRRRGLIGILDRETGTWKCVQDRYGDIWVGYGFGSDYRAYISHLNAKEIRKTFQVVAGNDFALPNFDKSPSLSVIVGGAA